MGLRRGVVTTTTSVHSTARTLHEAGWSPLPLPAGTKGPPPNGFTGYNGRYVTARQIDAWENEGRWTGNIAIRLPPGVIGLDVDAYKGGGTSLHRLIAKHGPLPDTIRSTSRNDGSGIALFRIPAGIYLDPNPADGIEVIQAHHRYLVCSPSIHPEGRPYIWIHDGDDDWEPLQVPDYDDIPELPWSFVEALAVDKTASVTAATPDQAQQFIARHARNLRPSALKGVQRSLAGAQGSRHDNLVEHACWALREAAAGLYPAQTAIDALHDWWRNVMTTGNTRDAERRDSGEFGGAIMWAVAQVENDPERVAQIAQLEDVAASITTPAPPPNIDPDTGEIIPADHDEPLAPTFEPVDLEPVLTGDYHQPEPCILRREDGQALFYMGQINGIHGPSGEGKSFMTMAAMCDEIRRGHNVIFVDLEDTAPSIVARLRLLGATDEQIRTHVTYLRPAEPFGMLAVERLCELVSEKQPRLVVVDSLGEAFGLDGIDENSDADVGPWLRRVPRRIADMGPAVILVDHSTKANDNPLYPSGSKRKRAAIGGASYLVTATKPLAAGHGGTLRIVCAKDRHGTYARNEHVANWVLNAAAGMSASWTLYDGTPLGTEEELPVILAAKAAVKALEEHGGELTSNALLELMKVKGRVTVKRAGVDLAVANSDIIERPGPRKSRLFSLPGEGE